MILDTFQLVNVRNWRQSQLSFSPGTNLIVGANGSGKSALLEAIFLIAHPFTFRTNSLKTVMRHGEDCLRILATLSQQKGEVLHQIGIERQRDAGVKMRLNAEPVHRLTDIAELCPIRASHPESHLLISGAPQFRRSCLDWGVFHAVGGVSFPWREYKKALSLKSALLRSAASEREKRAQIQPWDRLLAEKGEQIQAQRHAYVQALQAPLAERVQALGFDAPISLSLHSGWRAELSLLDALEESRERSLQQRTTLVGPHRADLVFRYRDQDVRHVFSRGQTKLLALATLLAQSVLLLEQAQKHALFLLDDLHAELDEDNYQRCLDCCQNLPLQLFVTESRREPKKLHSNADSVFHVEHGDVKQVL